MNIVLFNRDLRISDHQPLKEACKSGEVLPLYIFEPSIWNGSTLSARHFQFVLESLEELAFHIKERGGVLYYAIGELTDVLEKMLQFYASLVLFVHKETTPEMKSWMNERNQQIIEFEQRFKTPAEKINKTQWTTYMNEPIIEAPNSIFVPDKVPDVAFTDIKRLQGIKVKGSKIRFGQQGGEGQASETLDSFLEGRFANYLENYEKPIASSFSSSRLSAYLAWGNISGRTVYQKTMDRMLACENEANRHQLAGFLEMLYLRDKATHLQKVKGTVSNQICAKRDWNEEVFLRWLKGKTGIPIIDAAMRSLVKTGWVNFAFREMLLSFICNTMLADRKRTSEALGSLSLDYDSSLHEYYTDRLAGTAGKMMAKLINPVKFGKAHDPEGSFIRRYVPELSKIPAKYIHEPWLYPGFYHLGYEVPIVDIVKANKAAKLHFEGTSQNGRFSKARKMTSGPEQLSFDLEDWQK